MTTSPIRATSYALTDRGRTREHNEDTFLLADLASPTSQRASEAAVHPVGDRGVLYLVADGMGGAAAGELASEMAAVQIHQHLVEVWRADRETSNEKFAQRLREAVESANTSLHEYSHDHPEVRGMGTTATVAGIWGARLYLAQVGDSRAYLIRHGHARQLTRDQSLTQRLVEVGELTEEEAETSERRNIILQALGPDPRVSVDISYQELQRDDILIICSDGLSSVVKRDELGRAVSEATTMAEICERLVGLANEHGGPDNITVVAVHFDGEGLPLRATEEPGYHEFLTPADRPALQPTAAFPAATFAEEVVPEPGRRGSPTGLALLMIALAMGIIAAALWLGGG
jgi:protein phosphatase